MTRSCSSSITRFRSARSGYESQLLHILRAALLGPSSDPAEPSAIDSWPSILMERRSKSRYPLEFGVRFRLISEKTLLVGVGQTVNLSAGGLLVSTEDLAARDEIGAGARFEMRVEWPVLLDGRIPLQLHAVGRVVRRGAIDFAAAFERYQFRTKRHSRLPQPFPEAQWHEGNGG